ncbi:MAG: hypothetical protein ACREUW_02390, partial [Burkholderiales bacterium]
MVSRTDSRTFAIFVAASLAAHVAALAVWRMPPPVTDAEPAFRVEILPLQPVASAADLAAPAPRSPTPPPLK